MPERGHQKLEVEVKAQGFVEAAKKSEQLDDAQRKLTKRMESAKEGFEDTGKKLEKLGDVKGGLRKRLDDLLDLIRRKAEPVRRLGDHVGHLTWGMAKLVLALKATSAAFRALPAIGALVQGVLSTISVLRQEIQERLRLIEVMKIQGRVQDELQQKQVSQQQTLERIAAQRRTGGFTADAARRVQAMAARAQEQFPALEPGDINLAFGMFGDLGFTQRQLTDLAILAYQGKLKTDPRWSQATRGAYGEWQLSKHREGIETFARRETRQEGLGRPEYASGQPTEKEQRILANLLSDQPLTEETKARLAELLPPQISGTPEEWEKVMQLVEQYRSSGELATAALKTLISRPLMGAWKRTRVRPTREIAYPGKGFWGEMWATIGVGTQVQEIGVETYDALMRAFGQMSGEGQPGAGFDRTPAATQQPVTINQTTINNQGAWQTYPDAASQRRAQRGAEHYIEVAER